MSDLKLNLVIDVEPIVNAIKEAKDLNDNNELFRELSNIQLAKKEVNQLNEVFEDFERSIKQQINDKAKTLYGKEWESIKGTGYKISRSFTGSVYELTGDDVDDDFIQIKLSANTKAIENYEKEKNALPKGISLNESRGEQIRITVNDR